MPARGGDLREAILHALRIVQIHRGNGRQPHNGVHRRADVMAHGIEEVSLRAAGTLGFAEGILQGDAVRNLALLHIGDILYRQKHARHLLRRIALKRQHRGLQPAHLVGLGILQAVLEMQVRHVRRQVLANELRHELGLHTLGFLVIAETRLPIVPEHMVLAVARQIVFNALVLQVLVGIVDQIDHREALEERQRRVHDARHVLALAQELAALTHNLHQQEARHQGQGATDQGHQHESHRVCPALHAVGDRVGEGAHDQPIVVLDRHDVSGAGARVAHVIEGNGNAVFQRRLQIVAGDVA